MTDKELIEGINIALFRQHDMEGDTGKVARAFTYVLRLVESTSMGSTFNEMRYKAELNGTRKED